MIRNYIILIAISIIILNCSDRNNLNSQNNSTIKNPEQIYIEAINLFDSENIELAQEKFLEVKKLYPLSNEAIQAEVMIGFINYLKMDYESAIVQFNRIILKYPSYKELDYIYYMIAMCNYEQITHHALDGKFNELALEGFTQVINRFPKSKYAQDSRQKIILVKSNKAAKHIEIGRFYLKEKKYTAALNRFKIVIDEYSMTKFAPEALHRMVEAYQLMGMYDESYKTASVLGHNYPNSKWYKYSYELIKKDEKKETIFKKVKNLF